MFGHLDYTGRHGKPINRPKQCLSVSWCKQMERVVLPPVLLTWNSFIWLYAPLKKTVTQAWGMATTRAIRGWDRQAETVPCCPTFPSSILPLWAAASCEQACEFVTHFPTLARGLAWETHHTIVFWLKMSRLPSHRQHLCASDYLMQGCAFPLPSLQTHVHILMQFKQRGGRTLYVFDLHAAGFHTDSHCQQALRYERAPMSPLPVLRHNSA